MLTAKQIRAALDSLKVEFCTTDREDWRQYCIDRLYGITHLLAVAGLLHSKIGVDAQKLRQDMRSMESVLLVGMVH